MKMVQSFHTEHIHGHDTACVSKERDSSSKSEIWIFYSKLCCNRLTFRLNLALVLLVALTGSTVILTDMPAIPVSDNDAPESIKQGHIIAAKVHQNHDLTPEAMHLVIREPDLHSQERSARARLLAMNGTALLSMTRAQGGWPNGSSLEITDFELENEEIHPILGDDIEGTFTINAAAAVTMEIRREKDSALVYQDSDIYSSAGEYPFTWDGRDNVGDIVSSGLYRIVLIAEDGVDKFTYDPIAPPGSGGVFGDVNNATYAPYRNSFFKIEVDMDYRGLLTMEVTPEGASMFFALKDAYFPAGHSPVYWDGRDPSGEIVALADKGNPIWYPIPKTVRPTAIHVLSTAPRIYGIEYPDDALAEIPRIEVRSDPYLISHSYEQISNIWFHIDIDSYVTVKMLPPGIYDPENSAAITLIDNEFREALDSNGDPIDHLAEWTGYHPTSPNEILFYEEGAFTFTIEAEGQVTGKTNLYRGVLNIRH